MMLQEYYPLTLIFFRFVMISRVFFFLLFKGKQDETVHREIAELDEEAADQAKSFWEEAFFKINNTEWNPPRR